MNTPISSSRIYLALMVMALTIYAVRVLPFLFLRKPIQNRFVRSFLFYVPYVTLAVMTFPAILTATSGRLPGSLLFLQDLSWRGFAAISSRSPSPAAWWSLRQGFSESLFSEV